MDTKERILALLLGAKKGAAAIAKELGIRVSAARTHLEGLVGMGLVSSSYVRSGRGRPKKVYQLTEQGLERFPRRYDEVLELLVGELERGGQEEAARHIRAVAKELAQKSSGGVGLPVTPREAAKILDALGFHTSYAERGGAAQISSANCVLRRVALKHPSQICRGLHTWLIEELTGVKGVRLEKCMAYGHDVCVHAIPKRG